MRKQTLNVVSREKSGRGAARRLRAKGGIPAILYGKDTSSTKLTVKEPDFLALMRKTQGSASLLSLQNEKSEKFDAIIQATQRNSLTERFEHIDFLALIPDRAINAHIPVHATGEATGVKTDGGLLEILLHEVNISCLPRNLPESVEIDISGLGLNQNIHIKDLPKLENVQYTGDPNAVVIACIEAAQEEETPESTAAAESEGENTDEAEKPKDADEAEAKSD